MYNQRRKHTLTLIAFICVIVVIAAISFRKNITFSAAPNASTHIDVTNPDILSFLIIGKDNIDPKSNGSHIRGALIVAIDPQTDSTVFYSLSSDCSITKGGTYKSYIYGGNNTLDSIYCMGFTWNGAKGAKDIVNQAMYNNYGIDIDCYFEIDSEEFTRIQHEIEKQSSINTIS